jgi:hypothetical protein
MRMKLRVLAAFLTLALSTSVVMRAQSVNSSVQGTVADISDAKVPGAAISLTNVSTGVALRTQSDEQGNYSFPALQPGLYSRALPRTGCRNSISQWVNMPQTTSR